MQKENVILHLIIIGALIVVTLILLSVITFFILRRKKLEKSQDYEETNQDENNKLNEDVSDDVLYTLHWIFEDLELNDDNMYTFAS